MTVLDQNSIRSPLPSRHKARHGNQRFAVFDDIDLNYISNDSPLFTSYRLDILVAKAAKVDVKRAMRCCVVMSKYGTFQWAEDASGLCFHQLNFSNIVAEILDLFKQVLPKS